MSPDAVHAAKSNPDQDRTMTPPFNPIEYSSELEAAGVDKAQATVHAKALSTVLADVVFTQDLAKVETSLRKEIRHTEEMLSARIESVRTDLGARIDKVHVEVNANIERLRIETSSQFIETNSKFVEMNSKFTETNSKFYALNVEMVIHRWALGILMAMSATTLALVVRPLLA